MTVKTAVFISNEQIQILRYNKSGKNPAVVNDYIVRDLPERAVFNGVITDRGSLSARIGEIVAENRGVFQNASLILETNSIITKKIPVPKLSERQYRAVAQEELSNNTGDYGDLMFDSQLLNEKSGQFILACAVDKNIVEDYQSIFRDAGVKLEGISFSLDLMIALAKQESQLSEETVVLSVVDGISVHSAIFDKGDYVFSTRARLFADDDESVARRLLESVTSRLQFNKAISKVFFSGVSPEILSLMRDIKSANLEIAIDSYDPRRLVQGGDSLPDNFFYPILGTTVSKTTINLLATHKKSLAPVKTKRVSTGWRLIAAGAAIVAAAALAFVTLQYRQLEKQSAEIEKYLLDPVRIEQMAELDILTDNIGVAGKAVDEAALANTILEDYTVVSTDAINWLFSQGRGIVIRQFSFNAAERTLQLVYNCPSELDSSSYVEAIKTYKEFSGVTYTGYAAETNGSFTFKVLITLVGKEA